MAEVSRLLRGTLGVLAALTVASAFALPANAGQPGRAGQPVGPDLAAQWWLAALHVPQAWEAAPARGGDATVAVLSTGVDAAHQDLSGAVLTGPDYSGSGRAAGGPYWGFEGTAVAALIAGHGHGVGDASGSTGVAPRARILSVQVTLEYNDPLNSDAAITGRLPGAIAAGIKYAVSHGARVIALPLDPGTLGFTPGGDAAAAGGSQAERAAVGYAVAHDVVLVAPAGDNGEGSRSVNYPAAYPGVLAVGATARDGRLVPFANAGPYVALTAPGAGLTVAAPDGGYDVLSSTDMAAALAAGVAALIRSRFPDLTAAGVVQAMEQGATGQRVPGAGHGALDAAGALAAAAQLAARQSPATAPPSPTARPAPRLGVTPRATAHRSGTGTLAGSLVRDAVIVVGVLIAALAAALAAHGARRRRAARRAAPPRSGRGGVHARQARAALPAALSAGQPPAGSVRMPLALGSGDHAGSRPAGLAPAGAGPRLAPPPPPGSLGRPPRTRRPGRAGAGEPPWEPARAPEAAAPVSPWPPPRPALGPASGAPRDAAEGVPPWELAAGAPSAPPGPPAAPGLPELPVASTGPMYIWNPSASGPQPAAPDAAEPEE